MTSRYLDDYQVGQRFETGRHTLDSEQIKAFADNFDPQPFHLDEKAAEDSFFQGLAASGWHTAAISMRLMVESDLNPAGGVIGAGVEALRWYQPVRPNEVLYAVIEVLEVRPSRSKPNQGMLKIETVTFNQRDEKVQSFVSNLLVQRST